MSFIAAAGVILSALLALICFTMVTQTIERNNKKKRQTITSLKRKAQSFRFIIDGFPPNFLSKDLKILVNKCILEVYQQLAELEPREAKHIEEIRKIFLEMEQAKKSGRTATKRTAFQTKDQIDDAKQHLIGLEHFVAKLYKRKTISKDQAIAYGKQIQSLVIQTSLDSYRLAADAAISQGKYRLAIHYYTMAKKQLLKANNDKSCLHLIEEVESIIKDLEAKDKSQLAGSPAKSKSDYAQEKTNKDWEKFQEGRSEDKWKKKSIYD